MNDFFNTNTTKTYSIRTTKGDYTFTAQDIAKIVAFGDRYITWSGLETWIAPGAVADMLALFCTEEGEERGQLRGQLCNKVDTWESDKDAALVDIIDDARNILSQWGGLKLYTCLSKKFEGSDEKYINLDKLEAMLGIELGDAVRERLSHVSVKKDSDGDWVFIGATGVGYRETATIGILVEVRDAVQFFPTMLKHVLEFAKAGYETFEQIMAASGSMNIARWTQGDIQDIKQALVDANVQPDRYTVYFTTGHYFASALCDAAEQRWDFDCEVSVFDTKKDADEFVRAANDNYRVEKKRQKLLAQLEDSRKYIETMQAEYDALLA